MSAIVLVLKGIRGLGPVPWEYVRYNYLQHGGETAQFGKAIALMGRKYPHRLIVTRGYNVSEGAMIEVPA